jgi:hypothetical protein
MDTNLIFFLLGLFLSIPIGILVNLFTPRIQEWLINRPKVSATKKIDALQKELAEIDEYFNNRDRLLFHTISSAFLVFMYLSVGNMAWVGPSIFPFGNIFFYFGEFITSILTTILSIVAFVCFLNVILVCLNLIRLMSKIKNYDKYKADIETKIGDMKSQGIAAGIKVGFTIESAIYGADDHLIDVTDIVQSSISNGKLRVIAGNQLIGDPSPGTSKTLTINYTYNGKREIKVVKEGDILSLPV